MRLFRSVWRREGASVVVETAFVMIFLFPLMIGMVEFAWAYWNWNSLQFAAQQGARYAMVRSKSTTLTACTVPSPVPTITGCGSVTPAALPNCAAYETSQNLFGFDSTTVALTITCAGSGPTTMTVTATSSYDFVAATLLPYGPITMTGTALVPLL